MALESNYYPYTKDEEERGWMKPAFAAEFSKTCTLRMNVFEILFVGFVAHCDTAIDAISLIQGDTKNNKLGLAIYNSDKYGIPKERISNFYDNEEFQWETNTAESTPTSQPIFSLKGGVVTGDDNAQFLKKGLFWVAVTTYEQTSKSMFGTHKSFPGVIGLKSIGSDYTILSYNLSLDEIYKEGDDDNPGGEFTTYIFPKTLKPENFVIDDIKDIKEKELSVFVHISNKKKGK